MVITAAWVYPPPLLVLYMLLPAGAGGLLMVLDRELQLVAREVLVVEVLVGVLLVLQMFMLKAE
jgi:hypothetical protein